MESPKYLLEEEEGIDLRKWFFILLEKWHFFLIVSVFALIVAYFYNKYTLREYHISTSILIKEETDPLDRSNMLRVSLYNDPFKLENEIGIIHSSEIKKRTLKELNFFIEYFEGESFERKELNNQAPFMVFFDSSHVQPVDVEFQITYLTDSTLIVQAKTGEFSLYSYSDWRYAGELQKLDYSDTIFLGDTIKNSYCNFLIGSNLVGISPGYRKNTYYFTFRSLPMLLSQFGGVEVKIPKNSSIMSLSLNHSNPLKAAMYLNSLVDNYLDKGIERENRVAQRTIDFIDFQLSTLVDSLQNSEQKLEDFRSSNKIISIDYQAQYAYSRQTELERQKAELIVQRRYLNYLKENLSSNSIAIDELVAPSTLGIEDAVLNDVVSDLVKMYTERTELKLNSRKDNPYIISLDNKVELQKNKLAETVDNILNAKGISLDEIVLQLNEVSQQLSKIPKDQRELLRFERKFQLNDELYTYLLTRRSEMQIKKASNLPSNEVLERAYPEEAQLVHPNKKLNYIIALLCGFMIPFGLIYIKASLNNKIQSADDIKQLSKVPVIGTIYQNDNTASNLVVNSANSLVAESFRMLRANLQFVVSEDKSPILVVTSAMKGEGKSFTALNLAAIHASYGKKVCLIDLDLRRPRLSEYLKVDKHDGMSNFLIGKAELDDIIIPIENSSFDLIPSGPIPPNPSELVASKKLEDSLGYLRKRYEYIILDSPPIGMVSDAMFISKHVGYLLLVVRHNVTYKQLLSNILEEIERNQLRGINLIYNDVPTGKKGYYRYGAKYGYYSREKKGFFSKWFS